MSNLDKTPYKPLGRHLKDLRTKINESLAEASGAVEIDVRELASFELGKKRPSEDVLLLLISHFGAKDDEAVRIWDMAGYGTDHLPVVQMGNSNSQTNQASNESVLYTDTVDIMVNNYGVVMNFMQGGAGNVIKPVARIGMSREHAKSVLKILEVTLNQTEQHQSRTTDNRDDSAKRKLI
jgi:transcriptional regulator with XRE-family HTH domain